MYQSSPKFTKPDFDALTTKWLVQRVGLKKAMDIQNLTLDEMEKVYMRLQRLRLIPTSHTIDNVP